MLRLLYMGIIFKWHSGGSWRVLCCGCFKIPPWCKCLECWNLRVGSDSKERIQERHGGWTSKGLKRRLIKRTFSPSLALSSIVADIDVSADWYFWTTSDFETSKYAGLDTVALTFTVLGTLTWLLLATDGLGWLRVYACNNASSGVFRYWSLINSFVEDLPQLIITFMTTGFSTVAGALNIATAVFAFMGKVAEAYASRVDDLPSDFSAVKDPETRPLVTAKLELEDEMATKSANIQEALPMIALANSTPGTPTAMKATYEVARKYVDWVSLIVAVKMLNKSLFVVADDDGKIPEGLGELEQLEHLLLRRCNRAGTIPVEMGKLINLKGLYLDHNDLTGPIPNELFNQTKLKGLYLDHNRLSGRISADIGRLDNLRQLDLSGNQLTGCIPEEIGVLTKLEKLLLNRNRLTGSIPLELGSCKSLLLLYLNNNDLTGPIPAQLGDLPSLFQLNLSNNNLTGSIPVELAKLGNLAQLHVRNNNLTGSLPEELRGLISLRELYLEGNENLAGAESTDIRE
ncbi:unnamed protein product [Ectocarpus sp. 12 AP-2014]